MTGRVPGLRAMMAAGYRPDQLAGLVDQVGDVAGAALTDLAYLADQVENYGWQMSDAHRRLLDEHGDSLSEEEVTFERWKVELHDDTAVRRWFLAALDPSVLAEVAALKDLEARPFTFEVDDGPFRCSNCGQVYAGRHARILDRSGLLETSAASDGDFRYCGACLAGVARQVTDG